MGDNMEVLPGKQAWEGEAGQGVSQPGYDFRPHPSLSLSNVFCHVHDAYVTVAYAKMLWEEKAS